MKQACMIVIFAQFTFFQANVLSNAAKTLNYTFSYKQNCVSGKLSNVITSSQRFGKQGHRQKIQSSPSKNIEFEACKQPRCRST